MVTLPFSDWMPSDKVSSHTDRSDCEGAGRYRGGAGCLGEGGGGAGEEATQLRGRCVFLR